MTGYDRIFQSSIQSTIFNLKKKKKNCTIVKYAQLDILQNENTITSQRLVSYTTRAAEMVEGKIKI